MQVVDRAMYAVAAGLALETAFGKRRHKMYFYANEQYINFLIDHIQTGLECVTAEEWREYFKELGENLKKDKKDADELFERANNRYYEGEEL